MQKVYDTALVDFGFLLDAQSHHELLESDDDNNNNNEAIKANENKMVKAVMSKRALIAAITAGGAALAEFLGYVPIATAIKSIGTFLGSIL